MKILRPSESSVEITLSTMVPIGRHAGQVRPEAGRPPGEEREARQKSHRFCPTHPTRPRQEIEGARWHRGHVPARMLSELGRGLLGHY